MKILNLVSGPRNISTALMYSFANRADTKVLDEPYYAVYLEKSGAPHPGRDEVLGSMSSDESEVTSRIQNSTEKPILFIKNMAHHIEVLKSYLIEGAENIFLIRDPLLIITSYAAVIEKPVMRDIGIEFQHILFKHIVNQGIEPIVIDSGFLLRDPEAVLRKLCLRCQITFDPNMLRWPAGPKPFDGIWAPYWYSNVHRSTHFERPPTPSRTLDPALIPLHERARELYEKLLPFSLKA